MKVVFFSQLPHHSAKYRIFAAGMQRHGIYVETAQQQTNIDCDLAVFWSHKLYPVIQRQKAAGNDYLVIEAGYVGDRINRWWSLGFNGLNGRAERPTDRWAKVPGDRWSRLESEVELRAIRGARVGYPLLLGQVPGDANVQGLNLPGFYNMAKRQFPDLVFRPHPLHGYASKFLPACKAETLAEALDGASFVITFNSNSGVDAVLRGVPVIAMDRGSMVYRLAGNSFDGPPPPYSEESRLAWAFRIAYAQWTPDEIERGDAWDYLRQRYQ